MAIYKRCAHRGRDRDRCAHPWYGGYKLPGEARARVSPEKWSGADVRTKGQAQAAFDDFEGGDPRRHLQSTWTKRVDSPGRDDVPAARRRLPEEVRRRQGTATASEFKYRVKPLLAHFGSRPITKIRTSDIEDLQAELRRPRLIQGAMRQPSKASVNRPVSDLRRILNWAVSREYIGATPFRRGGVAVVKLDKEDLGRNRRISAEEEERLIQAAPPHLRALIIIALDTGVRAGEMLAIRIKDADLERNQITLRGTTTKSAKTRVVPIPTLRLRTVVEWLRFDAIGKPKPVTAPLISNEVGEAMGSSRTAWATAVLKAHGFVPTKEKPLRRIGTANLLPEARAALQRIDLHWHDLRHEYACRLAERGVPVTKIQALLGHAAITTTMRYIHHTLDELAKATTVLETGGVFDPNVGRGVSSVSQVRPVAENAKSGGVH